MIERIDGDKPINGTISQGAKFMVHKEPGVIIVQLCNLFLIIQKKSRLYLMVATLKFNSLVG